MTTKLNEIFATLAERLEDRAGTKMTSEEASEEITELMGVKVNAKQIERLCHHYEALLEQVDWKQAYAIAHNCFCPLKIG